MVTYSSENYEYLQRQIHTFLRTLSWGDSTEPELQARVMKAVAYSLRRSHTECLKGFQCLVSFIKRKKKCFGGAVQHVGSYSLTGDQTCTPLCIGSSEVQLDCQGSPNILPFLFKF